MNQYTLTMPYGTQYWYLDTEDRSESVLSSIINVSSLHWHRLDGPAIIYASGYRRWYVNNYRYCNNKSFQEVAGITDEEMMIVILKYGNVR